MGGIRCQISPEIVGYPTFRALIRTGFLLDSYRKVIFNWAKQQPIIVSLMHGRGSWQYELRNQAPSFAEASEASEELSDVLKVQFLGFTCCPARAF